MPSSSWLPVHSRGAIVRRGARAGSRSGAIAGGAVGTLFWPVGGTVFGALVGALVGVCFGLGTGAVLAVMDVGSEERTRVRWAGAFAAGTAAVLVVLAAGLSGALAVYVAVGCAALAALDAPRVAFGPAAPWSVPRRRHGGSALSEVLDWAAGGVAAGLGSGCAIGMVEVVVHPDATAARVLLDGAAAGVGPGLVLGALVGTWVVTARRCRWGHTAES